jgi:glyoxylase-like metal-dependent hydrolase (beta-lactamase superfamily II)
MPDDPRPQYGNDDRTEPDAKVIDAHINAADVIVITHTHLDHAFDMSCIARKTGATVVGTKAAKIVPKYFDWTDVP